MSFNHKLFATRGYHPSYRTTFSIATRGFSFGDIPAFVQEYGIRLMSYITAMFASESPVNTPVELDSKI